MSPSMILRRVAQGMPHASATSCWRAIDAPFRSDRTISRRSMRTLFPFVGICASPIFPLNGIVATNGMPDNPAVDLPRVVRENLQGLLDAANDGVIRGPGSPLELEALSDVGKSTIYRILDPKVANDTSINNLQRLAGAYGLNAWQLLVPRIDPRRPPQVLTDKEREDIEIMRVVYQQVNKLSGRDPGTTPDPDHPRTPSSRNDDSGTGKDSSPKPSKRRKAPRH